MHERLSEFAPRMRDVRAGSTEVDRTLQLQHAAPGADQAGRVPIATTVMRVDARHRRLALTVSGQAHPCALPAMRRQLRRDTPRPHTTPISAPLAS